MEDRIEVLYLFLKGCAYMNKSLHISSVKYYFYINVF